MPVIASICQYKTPAKYDDLLLIRTRITQIKGVRLEFSYEIIRETGDVILSEGKTNHAFADRALKPVNLKKVNTKIWKVLINCLEEVK